jgi:hypothetical protein
MDVVNRAYQLFAGRALRKNPAYAGPQRCCRPPRIVGCGQHDDGRAAVVSRLEARPQRIGQAAVDEQDVGGLLSGEKTSNGWKRRSRTLGTCTTPFP